MMMHNTQSHWVYGLCRFEETEFCAGVHAGRLAQTGGSRTGTVDVSSAWESLVSFLLVYVYSAYSYWC
jgi:hypothetical protein